MVRCSSLSIVRTLVLALLFATGCPVVLAAPNSPTIIKLADSSGNDPALTRVLARGFLQARGGQAIKELKRGQQTWIYAQTGSGQVQIGISRTNRPAATQALQNGDLDLMLSSGRASQELLSRLQPQSDQSPGEQVVALQAVALAVHRDNALKALDETRLLELLRQGHGNWRSFQGKDRGKDTPITLLASDRLAPNDLRHFTRAPIERRDAVSLNHILNTNPDALALVPLRDAGDFHTLPISTGGTIVPPRSTLVASEDYPLTRRLYLYNRNLEGQPELQAFIEFLLSEPGQQLFEKNGLVSLVPQTLDKLPDRRAPAPYRKLMSEGQRLSIAFRFEHGGSGLDARARRDIVRLANFMRKPENRDRKIALVGFSDRQRRDAMARTLSRFRTVIVHRHLREADLSAEQTLFLGYSAPLTDDQDTSEQRNSRVEVWLL